MSEDKFVQHYEGVDVMFDPAPHAYHLQFPDGENSEVPSISDIMDYLPKYLGPWGQDNGIKGMMELVRRSLRPLSTTDIQAIDLSRLSVDDPKFNLTEIRKLGMDNDSIRDAAAARGTTVHSEFRGWVVNGHEPDPKDYGGEVAGYVKSLRTLTACLKGKVETVLCEQPIASSVYGVAGTPDWLVRVTSPLKVQKGGNLSKRPNYVEYQAGQQLLIDFKTSKQVFLSHTYQLSGYELMLRELGILGGEVKRVVCLVKPDGEGVNFREQPDRLQGFLAALGVYNAEKRPEGWMGRQTFVGLGGVR